MSRLFAWLISRLLPWLEVIHAVVFIAFWLTNSLFYASTNDYLADMLGWRLNYVSILIWVSAFVAAWSAIRFVLGHLRKTHKLSVFTSWLFGIVALIYIVFFYGSFNLLFSESPVQFVRIGQLIGYFRLFLEAVLLLGLALLAGFLIRNYLHRRKLSGMKRNWWLLVLVLLVLGILWSLPLIFPPDSVVRGPVPDKPLLIAHRGASMLAPENTLVAAFMAADMGVYGLETDIQISHDGALFLLHDDTFDRTTDIQSVFPGREGEPAANFTQQEISQLNAGKWFLEQDPFHALRRELLTPEQVREYQQQGVPLLADWLDIVHQNHLIFIFDLKPPPEDHPYAASLFERAFTQIHQAGIDPQVWFLVDLEQQSTLRQLAPQMLPAFGADYQALPTAAELKAHGYRIINVEYGINPRWIRQYRDAGMWVNVYTVDEPWQFSRLWLLGVNSITTSNATVMIAIDHPLLSLPYGTYILLWVVLGLVGVGLIIGLSYRELKPRRADYLSL